MLSTVPDIGLNHELRKTGPWGLPESVLAPAKVFTDPVHGDIHLTGLEVALLDTAAYQRLRRVRQLGMTHLVYPGAVHSRFSHGLGALRVAQMLLDTVWNHRAGLHATQDLFAQWQRENPDQLKSRWAEATVVARLGGLLHDLCHVPAGHTVEDDLKALAPHDANTVRFTRLWAGVQRDVRTHLRQRGYSKAEVEAINGALLAKTGGLHQELRPLIISKGSKESHQLKYPFCADLVGNTICADLLDYLARDHLFTGLPHSLGQRFISAFFVTPATGGAFQQRMALNIMRKGVERKDIAGELLKALRYRYELTERALVHHAKLAADAMLGEAVERYEWALWLRAVPQDELMQLEEVADAPKPDRVPLYRSAYKARYGNAKATTARNRVGKHLEELFSGTGDDGLLDFLAGTEGTGQDLDAATALHGHVRALASALRDRRLFRAAARVTAADASPEKLYQGFGAPAARAELERCAQEFIGRSGKPPEVLLWVPPAGMRLKLAHVLVKHEAGISPFVDYERARSQRGSDIYDAHNRLWAAYVFVDRDLSDAQARQAVAYLAARMGVVWERHPELDAEPALWPVKLALTEAHGVADADIPLDLSEWRDSVAARVGDGPTFKSVSREVQKLVNKARRS
jgi:HD superfamily phosphohydrolase